MKRIRINPISDKRKEQIKIERLLKAELIIKSGGKCMTCGKSPDFKDGRGELHLSHIIAKSQGGKTTRANCVVQCRVCHNLHHGIREV